jgi:hypothetical protein
VDLTGRERWLKVISGRKSGAAFGAQALAASRSGG